MCAHIKKLCKALSFIEYVFIDITHLKQEIFTFYCINLKNEAEINIKSWHIIDLHILQENICIITWDPAALFCF